MCLDDYCCDLALINKSEFNWLTKIMHPEVFQYRKDQIYERGHHSALSLLFSSTGRPHDVWLITKLRYNVVMP